MKLVKNASGKQTIKMSKSEWKNIGQKHGWMKKAQDFPDIEPRFDNDGYGGEIETDEGSSFKFIGQKDQFIREVVNTSEFPEIMQMLLNKSDPLLEELIKTIKSDPAFVSRMGNLLP
jgi:hypothetical protein